MAQCKLTKSAKVFMLQYRTNAGERRKPKRALYGELTVEQPPDTQIHHGDRLFGLRLPGVPSIGK